jgi:hypothetical protein
MNYLDTIEEHLTALQLNYERLATDRIGLGFSGDQRAWRLNITAYGAWLGFFVCDCNTCLIDASARCSA